MLRDESLCYGKGACDGDNSCGESIQRLCDRLWSRRPDRIQAWEQGTSLSANITIPDLPRKIEEAFGSITSSIPDEYKDLPAEAVDQ